MNSLLKPLSDSTRKWLEIIVGTIVCMIIVGYARPDDPLLLKLHFPWLILVPMLFALYYGSAAGGTSLAMIGGWQWVRDLLHRSPYESFPVEFLVGSFLVVLVTGQFCEIWTARNRRMSNVCAYAEDRLVRLSRDYYVLKLSYDRLVQMFAAKPVTLRDALTGVRKLVCDIGPSQPLAGADALLELLVHHYGLSRAGIYRCAGSIADAELAAGVGGMQPLKVKDPLVQFSLLKNGMVHVNSRDIEAVEQTDYLIVMPMRDHTDALIGMFVVADMPFSMLHEENLTAMQVMLAYYVADIDLVCESAEVVAEFPGCPRVFSDELVRLSRVVSGGGASSRLIAFAGSDEVLPLLQGILGIQRGLDFTWFASVGYRHVLIVLLPLADDTTVQGYMYRIEQWLKEQHGTTLQKAGIVAHFTVLLEGKPATYLQYLYRKCGLI